MGSRSEVRCVEVSEAATENIQADASDYASRNNRGVAYLETGEIQAALDDFTAVCQIAPHESSPLLSLAGIFEKRDDLQCAVAYATEAIRVEPANSTRYFVQKSIYQKLGGNIHAEEDHRSGNKCRVAEGYAAIKWPILICLIRFPISASLRLANLQDGLVVEACLIGRKGVAGQETAYSNQDDVPKKEYTYCLTP